MRIAVTAAGVATTDHPSDARTYTAPPAAKSRRVPNRLISDPLDRMNGISRNAETPAATPTSSGAPPPDSIRRVTKPPAPRLDPQRHEVPCRVLSGAEQQHPDEVQRQVRHVRERVAQRSEPRTG